MDNQEFDAEEESDEKDQEETYEFNFINIPWDNRTRESKVLMVTLLVTIFLGIFAVVINNIAIHYKNSEPNPMNPMEPECNLMRVENYPYVARIYSYTPNQLICLGVVLSYTTILTSGLCLKFSPTYLRLGSSFVPRCKKGYTIDEMFFISHSGAVTKSLAVLMTKEHLNDCSVAIPIGMSLDYSKDVTIIGKPQRSIKTLSVQLAVPIAEDSTNGTENNVVICVQGLKRCPVRISDLLIQNGKFYGLGSVSVHKKEHTQRACFASANVIATEIVAIDSKVTVAY